MDLNFVVGLVAPIAAAVALITAAVALNRQQRDSQRQAAREKTSRQRELSRCRIEAALLQEQLRLRIEFFIYKYLRLQERIAALLTKCSDPADKDELKDVTFRIEARLQRLDQNRADANGSIARIKDENFLSGKNLSDLNTLMETSLAAVGAVDDASVMDIFGDLERRVAQIARKLP